jgi:hypothetical protein
LLHNRQSGSYPLGMHQALNFGSNERIGLFPSIENDDATVTPLSQWANESYVNQCGDWPIPRAGGQKSSPYKLRSIEKASLFAIAKHEATRIS